MKKIIVIEIIRYFRSLFLACFYSFLMKIELFFPIIFPYFRNSLMILATPQQTLDKPVPTAAIIWASGEKKSFGGLVIVIPKPFSIDTGPFIVVFMVV